jgi:hypothetical protein
MIDEANLNAINETINKVVAENRHKRAEAVSTTLETWPAPPPGETCPLCERRMEPTPLEVWLAQDGGSLDSLAYTISDDPEVRAFLIGRRHGARVSKNLVWRLNHQAPDFTPRPGTLAAMVLPVMLRITGLQVADLQNERPTKGGYACGENGYQAALDQTHS